MTPLFATLASQSDYSVDDTQDGVRATQDVQQFTQTMQPGVHKGPFNWLTQSSLDTYADAHVPMETQTAQSTLLFSVGTAESQGGSIGTRRRLKPGEGFGKQKLSKPKPAASAEKKDDMELGGELNRLKRRFIKDREQSNIYFAKQQIRIKEMRQIAQKEQKVRRENQVTIYRKYRAGDLPDIQIKYSYIIAPLQALAHRDSTIAKLLMSGLFQAIFARMEETKTEREMSETIDQINTSLDNVLSQSTKYYPPFIGCILNIVYELRSQLKVSVSSVGSSAIFSKLQPLGITVIEEQLIQHEPAEARASKRRRIEVPVSDDVNQWIELARLFKSIDEYDTLMGIFSGKIGTQAITKEAVEAEARGDYHTAKKLYDKALHPDESIDDGTHQAEIDMWEEGRMECLQNLSQWDTLQKVSCDAVESNNLTDLWNDTYLQENFLPYILRSKVKLMLHGDENQQSLLDFVDASMRVTEQKLVLENGYSAELALMYLWQEDYDRARHYCNTALETFLQDWSSTDTLMMNTRTRAIQKLQPLIEMQEFLQFISDTNNFQSRGPSQRLVDSWNQRMPHSLTDPVTVWDDLVTNRSVYLDRISHKIQIQEDSQNSSMGEDSEDMFLDTKLRLKLKMAESAREQHNFSLTLKLLSDTRSDCRKDEGLLKCKWTHLYASTHQKKIKSTMDSSVMSEETLHNIYVTVDQLEKISENESLKMYPKLRRQHHVLAGQGLELLAVGIKDVMDIKELESTKVGNKLKEFTGKSMLNKLEVTEHLISEGYNRMRQCLSVDDVVTMETSGISQDEAYLATAKYCDNILRMKEDEDDENKLQVGKNCIKSFPETLVVCLLKAMKLNSKEAIQRFPRLLQIVELYPDTVTTFISKSTEVPCWMFIQWISQMLAILDKPEAKTVYHILEELTILYPQAVMYPMKLSREGYTFGSSKQDKMNEEIVDRLCAKLSPERLPLAHRFIAALECFGQPDQEFKDSFDDMLRLMQKGKKKEVVVIYKQLYDRILDYKTREKLESKSSKSMKSQTKGSKDGDTTVGDLEESTQLVADSMLDIGSYAKKFADEFKAEFDKRFGAGGKNIASMSVKDFNKHRGHLLTILGDAAKKALKPPGKLSEYSKWMADFKPNVNRMTLELPGQYSGLTKPLPEYHVKIAGFDERIDVMSSIRKPKKLMIRGNDEKDYPFLVKGGEDLRQDQRIEQLFYIMNQVFSKDSACRNRKLKLKMYHVIPMTPRVGLIEWVSDTIPLKNFISDSLTDQEKKAYDGKQGPNSTHVAWIQKAGGKGDAWPTKYFYNVYKKYSKTETIKQLAETESKVPWDLFRRSFQQLSTSPEAFHVLRCHSMQSHAMLSICQYILGIGDRHQSNFMINLKTGEMVGIDFGHAFGSATQFLPVPELIPFRLTRQFQNLMLPLQVKGLLENTMVHVLRALRSDSDLLLNTMDVFVKEPSLDWKQNAERQVQSMTDEDVELYSQEEELIQWYPKQKINVVKRKLCGANPAHITRDELKLGHGKKEAYKDFKVVALGERGKNIRADLPAHGLTVEQQVAALIDQATDPNILGRTWIGWEPWV